MASITTLATVLQFVHGEEKKTGAPARAPSVDALITSSEEVLASRRDPIARAFTKSMAKSDVQDILKASYRLSYLERAIATVEYLEYLRQAKRGMNTDELVCSLTVYNIAIAYADLIAAKTLDVRQSRIMQLQHVLLRGFR